jgi:integrase/recombinase XerC
VTAAICATDVAPDDRTTQTTKAPIRRTPDRGTRNLRAVQVLLGHGSITTTERYTAVDDAETRAAMVAAVGD